MYIIVIVRQVSLSDQAPRGPDWKNVGYFILSVIATSKYGFVGFQLNKIMLNILNLSSNI